MPFPTTETFLLRAQTELQCVFPEDYRTTARQWRGFPAAGVAFAANGSGDLLIFLPHEGNPGTLAPAVYLWSHETGKSAYIAASLSKLVDEA